MTEIRREDDGTFKCNCGKSFEHPQSLQRHTKGCSGQPTSIDDVPTDENMESEDESDASDLSEPDAVEDGFPADCLGVRKGWTRRQATGCAGE